MYTYVDTYVYTFMKNILSS